MSRTAAPIALAALLACLASPAPARAETLNCTAITSLPATLSSQGVYCLKKDLATALASGAAITIAANNVTLDCNGYKLGGLMAGVGTQAVGIQALDRLNATVRNCNVRGFRTGVQLGGSGHVARDNRFDGNTQVGLALQGSANSARGNRVNDTGGANASSPFAGIYATGGADVLDNSVNGVVATDGSSEAVVGIYTYGNVDGSIAGNRVRALAGTSYVAGIRNDASGRVSIRDNTVAAPQGQHGIYCVDALGVASGNELSGFTTAVGNCADGAGNLAF